MATMTTMDPTMTTTDPSSSSGINAKNPEAYRKVQMQRLDLMAQQEVTVARVAGEVARKPVCHFTAEAGVPSFLRKKVDDWDRVDRRDRRDRRGKPAEPAPPPPPPEGAAGFPKLMPPQSNRGEHFDRLMGAVYAPPFDRFFASPEHRDFVRGLYGSDDQWASIKASIRVVLPERLRYAYPYVVSNHMVKRVPVFYSDGEQDVQRHDADVLGYSGPEALATGGALTRQGNIKYAIVGDAVVLPSQDTRINKCPPVISVVHVWPVCLQSPRSPDFANFVDEKGRLRRGEYLEAQIELVRLCCVAALASLESPTTKPNGWKRVMLRIPKMGLGHCLDGVKEQEDFDFAVKAFAAALLRVKQDNMFNLIRLVLCVHENDDYMLGLTGDDWEGPLKDVLTIEFGLCKMTTRQWNERPCVINAWDAFSFMGNGGNCCNDGLVVTGTGMGSMARNSSYLHNAPFCADVLQDFDNWRWDVPTITVWPFNMPSEERQELFRVQWRPISLSKYKLFFFDPEHYSFIKHTYRSDKDWSTICKSMRVIFPYRLKDMYPDDLRTHMTARFPIFIDDRDFVLSQRADGQKQHLGRSNAILTRNWPGVGMQRYCVLGKAKVLILPGYGYGPSLPKPPPFIWTAHTWGVDLFSTTSPDYKFFMVDHPDGARLDRDKYQAAQHEVVRLCFMAGMKVAEDAPCCLLKVPPISMDDASLKVLQPDDRDFALVAFCKALLAARADKKFWKVRPVLCCKPKDPFWQLTSDAWTGPFQDHFRLNNDIFSILGRSVDDEVCLVGNWSLRGGIGGAGHMKDLKGHHEVSVGCVRDTCIRNTSFLHNPAYCAEILCNSACWSFDTQYPTPAPPCYDDYDDDPYAAPEG